LIGLEFDGSGTLLSTFTPNGVFAIPSSLVSVNPATGATTTIGLTGVNQIGGIAFDSGFSTLYGIQSNGVAPPNLYTINPATGAVTSTVLTTMPSEASSLEFVNGKLLAGGADDVLYEINTATGVAIAIGAMGTSGGKVSGLSRRPGTGLPATGPFGRLASAITLVVLGCFFIFVRVRQSRSIK
jgi:hypothetical protein